MEHLSPELVRAAHTVLEDLHDHGITLGSAYEGALVAAKGGGSVASCAKVILALEAGRQAVRWAATPGHSRSDTTIAAEILTLRRFRAVGREFEPNQRYRLTAAELAEVDWRAALEPNARIYDSPER